MNKPVMISIILLAALAGCSSTPAPRTPEKKAVLDAEVAEAIAIFRAQVPGIQLYFDDSVGYAVLPKVFKGAFIVGGIYGRGEVFESNALVGYCTKKGGTIGLSLGGRYFREIIFFQNEPAMRLFQSGEFAFSAEASAVALSAGAAAKAAYRNGMAVFVLTDTGLMADASLGGQRFDYMPVGMVVR